MTNFLVSEVVKNKQKDEKEDKRIDRRRKSNSKKTLEESEKDGKDADDFIIDEGRPIAEKRQKKSPIFFEAAVQESQDIFCVNFDYHKLRIYTDEDYEEDERDALVEDEKRSERSHRQELKTFDEGGSEGDYLDADNFIVDDKDRPMVRKRLKKSSIFFDAALQEAQSIILC